MGLPVQAEEIFAPPVAARAFLAAQEAAPLALFLRPQTREDFEGLALLDDAAQSGAGSVVIGDIGNAWDFATLNRAFRLLMAEPRPLLVALGMSRYAQGEDGLVLDVAPFTGKFRPRDLQQDFKPDAVLDSVADLPSWWKDHHGS